MPTGPSDIFDIEDDYERCRAYIDYFKEHGFEPPQSLNSLFKEIYEDTLADLIPEGVKLINKLSTSGFSTGNLYHQPVILGKKEDE